MPNVDENRLRRAKGQAIPIVGAKEMLLSLRIKSRLANLYEANSRKHEAYVLGDNNFQTAIEKGRNKLGLNLNQNISIEIDEDDIERWAVFVITGSKDVLRTSATYKDAADLFYRIVSNVLTEAQLPSRWDYYVAVYLLTGRPPMDNAFDFDLVDVLAIEDDGVSLKFKKGISKSQYGHLWQLITDVLGEPRTTEIVSKATSRNLAILKRKDDGLTYEQIAIEFFPAQTKASKAAAEDTVKKIVRREREKFKAGTKLVL